MLANFYWLLFLTLVFESTWPVELFVVCLDFVRGNKFYIDTGDFLAVWYLVAN